MQTPTAHGNKTGARASELTSLPLRRFLCEQGNRRLRRMTILTSMRDAEMQIHNRLHSCDLHGRRSQPR